MAEEVQLPRFVSQPSRWDRDLQARNLQETVAKGRRLRRNTILRTAVISTLTTFVVCALLNGAELMPAIQIKFWTH